MKAGHNTVSAGRFQVCKEQIRTEKREGGKRQGKPGEIMGDEILFFVPARLFSLLVGAEGYFVLEKVTTDS